MKTLTVFFVGFCFAFVAFAGSIQMSVTDQESGETKTIMDEEVYTEPSYNVATPPSESGTTIDRERRKLEENLQKAIRNKQEADEDALKAAKSGNTNKMYDAIAEQKKANLELEYAEEALYGREYVERKREERRLKNIERSLDNIERTTQEMERQQDYDRILGR